MTDDKDHNLVLDILRQLQEGQKSIKQTLRTELGSVRAELQIIQQQLTTSHNKYLSKIILMHPDVRAL